MQSIIGSTLWDLLADRSEKWGDKPVLLFPEGDITVTYRQVLEQAGIVAKGLIALGLERGENLALWSANRPDLLAIEFGAAAAGTPLVMLNSEYRIAELEYALQKTDVVALILADNNGISNDYIEAIGKLCPELLELPPGEWKSDKFPKLRYVIGLGEKRLPGMLLWSDFVMLGEKTKPQVFLDRKQEVSPEDTAFILFTSGTTGEPKGAMLSHKSLLINTVDVAKTLNFTESDRLCLPLPFFHAFAMGQVLLAIYFGAACIVYERYNANQILQTSGTGSTVLCGTPTMFIGWMEALEKAKSNGFPLITAILAGASCPVETVNQILKKTSIKEVWNLFGMTETFLVTANKIDQILDTEFVPIGKPYCGVETKIIDTTGESELQPGENGELLVRSLGNMKGYYGNPEATAKAVNTEGWYHSGDIAVMDLEGNISIVGRKKEVIIRGGENIFPREVEEYILTHPKIKEAQVVGIPSKYYGEEPVAFVILHQGETASQLELKKYCRERIALFKVPVYIYFIETFPKTASGKIQKFKLGELALEIINKKKEGK